MLRPGSGAGRARMVAIRCETTMGGGASGSGEADAGDGKVNWSRSEVVNDMHVRFRVAKEDDEAGKAVRSLSVG